MYDLEMTSLISKRVHSYATWSALYHARKYTVDLRVRDMYVYMPK